MVIGVIKNFLYSVFLCVFLPPLLNLFCFYLVLTVSVFYCAHPCMKCSLGISYFLEDIVSLFCSIVFLYIFAEFTKKTFLSLFGILWNSTKKIVCVCVCVYMYIYAYIYVYICIFFIIYLLVDIQVSSLSWLFLIMLQWTLVHMSFRISVFFSFG